MQDPRSLRWTREAQVTYDDSASLCPELTLRHPEIKERQGAVRHCRQTNERMAQLQAARHAADRKRSALSSSAKIPWTQSKSVSHQRWTQPTLKT